MARHHYTSGMLSDTRKNDTVIRLCRGAIDLDPNYARAYALMATAQRYRLGITGVGDNGDAAATRALELDGNLAEAHAAKAGVLTGEGDYAAAEQEITRALRLDPESPTSAGKPDASTSSWADTRTPAHTGRNSSRSPRRTLRSADC